MTPIEEAQDRLDSSDLWQYSYPGDEKTFIEMSAKYANDISKEFKVLWKWDSDDQTIIFTLNGA